MSDKQLKVGVLAQGFKPGTGPATYFTSVKEALGARHALCLMDGPCSQELDLVHVIDAKRVSPNLLDAMDAPLVVDFHDDYWTGFTPYPSPDLPLRWLRQKQLLRHHLRVIERAEVLIVHGKSVAASIEQVLESRSMRSPRIFIVPYGIDLELFAGVNGEDDAATQPLILFAGRDVFRKGFPVMAKALPRVLGSYPSARVAVIGDEYLHTRIAAGFISRGLPIDFLPVQNMDSLIDWYNRAGVLVLPSRQEAFGIVLIEAMASGLPVVAARTGGIPEAVEDNVSGLLHEPGDADDLAQKIVRMFDDSQLRKKLVSGGRQRAGTFSLGRMAKSLEPAYRAAVESR